jgi:hypothetical protein
MYEANIQIHRVFPHKSSFPSFITLINHLTASGSSRSNAELAIRPRPNLGRLRATGVTLVTIAVLALVLARVADLAGIAVVGVDTAQNTSVDGDRVLDDNVARTAVALAVSTAAHKLAVVFGVEVLDLNRSATVELYNLVAGVESSSTVDERGAAGLLESDGVFADISPPDVVQGTSNNVSNKH